MVETIKGAKELCRYLMKAGIPAFLHGKPGVGKSEAWQQLADEQGMGFIDLRLAQMDPVDLLGLQAVSGDTTIWKRPAYWPDVKRDGEAGILLFDEMADIGRAMQSAAYQIILNRRAGPHRIPDGWYLCAAGNKREHKATAQALSSALANRFAHIDVEPDPDTFIEWANANEVHPFITGFIRFRPGLLHSMDGADLRAFPTPRSWARASKVVEAPVSVRGRLLASIIGDGPSGELEAFLRVANDLPDLEDVLKDPKKCPIPSEPSEKYAMGSMLAQRSNRDNFAKILTYIGRREFGKDFEIVTALDATTRDKTLTVGQTWIDFANRNPDLVL